MSLAITNTSLLLGRELEYVEQGYIEIENGRIRRTAAGTTTVLVRIWPQTDS